jgi:hypothetical protein
MYKGIFIPDDFIDEYIEKKSSYIQYINDNLESGKIDVKTKSIAMRSLELLYEDMFDQMCHTNRIKLI